MRIWAPLQGEPVCRQGGEGVTADEAYEALEEIKKRHSAEHSGGCRILSLGDKCPCTMCLCDNVRRFIKESMNANNSE